GCLSSCLALVWWILRTGYKPKPCARPTGLASLRLGRSLSKGAHAQLYGECTMTEADAVLIRTLDKAATPLTGAPADFDAIIEAARGKRLVMIGEATHGTRDFYEARAQITRRLITELGFSAVAVEADWPDAYAINRHVWNLEPGQPAEDVFETFKRFPTWMWANTEVLAFVRWLASYNATPTRAEAGLRPVGFYGLDLYSMNSSAHEVIAYLDKHDPPAAARARERYACLDQFLDEPHLYGQSVEFGLSASR